MLKKKSRDNDFYLMYWIWKSEFDKLNISNNLKIDASSDTLILQNDESFQYFEYYNQIFPSKNFLVLAIQSNKKIEENKLEYRDTGEGIGLRNTALGYDVGYDPTGAYTFSDIESDPALYDKYLNINWTKNENKY